MTGLGEARRATCGNGYQWPDSRPLVSSFRTIHEPRPKRPTPSVLLSRAEGEDMVADSFEVLSRRLISASVSKDLGSAIAEWEVVALEEDSSGDGVCVCGRPNS
nr:hypothetical protein GCM10025699_17290 [Microbacterium flavescens]